MDGQLDTPYAGGAFKLDVNIPPDYPNHAPRIVFKTRIFHPNVDESG